MGHYNQLAAAIFSVEVKHDENHIVFDGDGYIHHPTSDMDRSSGKSVPRNQYYLNPNMYVLKTVENNISKLYMVLEPGLLVRIDHNVPVFEALMDKINKRYGNKEMLKQQVHGWRGGSRGNYEPHYRETLAKLTGAVGIMTPGTAGLVKWQDEKRQQSKISFNPVTDSNKWQNGGTTSELTAFTMDIAKLKDLVKFAYPGTHIQLVTQVTEDVVHYSEPEELNPKHLALKDFDKFISVPADTKIKVLAVNLIMVSKQWREGEQHPSIEVICFTEPKSDFISSFINTVDFSNMGLVGRGPTPALQKVIADLGDHEKNATYVKVNHSGVNVIIASAPASATQLNETVTFNYQYVQSIISKLMKFDETKMYGNMEEAMDNERLPVIDKKLAAKSDQVQEAVREVMNQNCSKVWMLRDHRIHPRQVADNSPMSPLLKAAF